MRSLSRRRGPIPSRRSMSMSWWRILLKKCHKKCYMLIWKARMYRLAYLPKRPAFQLKGGRWAFLKTNKTLVIRMSIWRQNECILNFQKPAWAHRQNHAKDRD
jgi:hypothetical protein